ncbi:hypothetical protein BGZ47_003557, partial [Haplosporangium gracile]
TPRSIKTKKGPLYATSELWHSLTIALMEVVNGKKNVAFLAQEPSMPSLHARLFDHAVESLKEYHSQEPQRKDITLVKDSQVSMSCVLNTMSDRVCEHSANDTTVIEKALELSQIPYFEDHSCSEILKKYTPFLEEHGVERLSRKLKIDLGALHVEHAEDERLSSQVEMEDKTLQILIHLPPSEKDCLTLWEFIFGQLTDKTMLEASKIMRRMQTAEYNDVNHAGRKLDCLFMMNDVELSNIEVKHPGSSRVDLTVQNRKNVRLARCIQESHIALGIDKPSILMADVCGFTGIFYQVQPMGSIAIAGKTTSTSVHLPRTAGALEAFLEAGSLAIIWNFISYLEKQGSKVVRAKERFQVAHEKAKLAAGLAFPRSSTSPPRNRTFEHNVTFSPAKKRTWSMSDSK